MKSKSKSKPNKRKFSKRINPVSPRAWRIYMEQVEYIHNALLEEKYPTALSLAEDLRISVATTKRIIRYMRKERELPIKVSRKPGKFGYYYAGEVSPMIGRTFTGEELIKCFVAHRSVEMLPTIDPKKRFELGFAKLSQLVDRRTLKILDSLQDTVYFRPFAAQKIDVDMFFAIADAIMNRQVVEFDYTKFRATESDVKTVHPYCFTCVGNSWYLIGYDAIAGGMRTYMLSRLENPVKTSDTFEKPKDWTLEKHLEGAFIILTGKESHDVVIEFDSWAAAYIRNREFTADQKIEELPHGGLRMSMHLTALEEVEAWVANWRQHAFVHSPPALQDRLFEYGQYLVKSYGPKGVGEGQPAKFGI